MCETDLKIGCWAMSCRRHDDGTMSCLCCCSTILLGKKLESPENDPLIGVEGEEEARKRMRRTIDHRERQLLRVAIMVMVIMLITALPGTTVFITMTAVFFTLVTCACTYVLVSLLFYCGHATCSMCRADVCM
jgi:hypothetical protein